MTYGDSRGVMRRAFAPVSVALSGSVLVLSLATAGCAGVRSHVIDAPSESLRSIYIVRRGWHTGVAVPTNDWPNRNWSLLGEFPEADYLEFGWGDALYYQAERGTFWMAMRAALWPTASVVHVIGLRKPLLDNAHALDIAEVRVPIDRVRTLATAIEQEFAGDEPVPTGATLRSAPEPNRFYEGRQRFFFPRMCNWWTATRLHDAGCPVASATVIFASRVMDEARECTTAVTPVR